MNEGSAQTSKPHQAVSNLGLSRLGRMRVLDSVLFGLFLAPGFGTVATAVVMVKLWWAVPTAARP